MRIKKFGAGRRRESDNNNSGNVENRAESPAVKAVTGETGLDLRFAVAAADFGVNMLKELAEDRENVLISPLSVETAMLLAANGASGNTLEEFRAVFGGEMSFEDLRDAASTYILNLPSTDKTKFHLANSVWIEENLRVREEFIRENREKFGAEVCQIPFNRDAVDAMNAWVEKNTDGQIDRIIDEVDPANMLYLINALSFDGEWQKIYESAQVEPAEFTGEDGQKINVTGLYSQENIYITNEICDGFIKPYADGNYSFAAFLPKEGVSVQDFVRNLDGRKLLLLPATAKAQEVDAMIPKFSVSYGKMLSALLMKLGLSTALGTDADFSGISDTAVGIDEVIHKTTLTLDERGTKAGAVTAVMMKMAGMPIAKPKVYLDRPFVYEIIENRSLLPIFIGVCMQPGEA